MHYPLQRHHYEKYLGSLATPFKKAKRLVKEREDPYRTPFQRDRDRIVHSNAFRRLKHKTQVFVSPVGDHFRTRLTHSLEVAQVARSLARLFAIDEDLCEAIALVHDIGHPPFGHSGEDALQEKMQPYGGFDHNNQALRTVCLNETRHPSFTGLNLTDFTLISIAKHNGPFPFSDEKIAPEMALELEKKLAVNLKTQPPLEAQFANIADDIAYNGHDLDDGFRAGILTWDMIKNVSWLQHIIENIECDYPQLDKSIMISECVRRIVGEMIHDVSEQTAKNIHDCKILYFEDVINHHKALVEFSADMLTKIEELRSFLQKNYYFSYQIKKQRHAAIDIIRTIFDVYMQDIDFISKYEHEKERALCVADYISGMTDQFATQEYCRISGQKIDHLPFQGRYHR